MSIRPRLLLVLLVPLLALLVAAEATAEASGTPTVTALIGYGLPPAADPDYDIWKLGLGLGGGYTFGASPLHVGARVLVHLGSDGLDNDPSRLAQLGAEVGWEFAVGDLVLRPVIGGGAVSVTSPLDDQGGFVSPYAELGASLDLLVGPAFVGLESRAVYIFEDINSGDAIINESRAPVYGRLGLRF